MPRQTPRRQQTSLRLEADVVSQIDTRAVAEDLVKIGNTPNRSEWIRLSIDYCLENMPRGLPPVPEDELQPYPTSLRLGDDVAERLDARARSEGRIKAKGKANRSELIRIMIDYSLKNMPDGWRPDPGTSDAVGTFRAEPGAPTKRRARHHPNAISSALDKARTLV
jgi:Arc/MetJ-type ribon-helix-helix transcriptional regulator